MRTTRFLAAPLLLAVAGCTNYMPLPPDAEHWEQARLAAYGQRAASAGQAPPAAGAPGAAVTTQPTTADPAAPPWLQAGPPEASLDPRPLPPMRTGAPATAAVGAPAADPGGQVVASAPAAVPAPSSAGQWPPPAPEVSETPLWEPAPEPAGSATSAIEPAPTPARPTPPARGQVPAPVVASPDRPTPTEPAASEPAPIEASPSAPSTVAAANGREGALAAASDALPPPALSGVGFLWPVPSLDEPAIVTGGIDDSGLVIEAPAGSTFVAAENGVVVFAADALETFGQMVVLRHDGDYTTAYAHAERLDVAIGDVVRRGQALGLIGDSGDAATPRLYFEMRVGSRVVDAQAYLVGTPRIASR